ncbi:MAG: aminopeptidase [Rubrivivax sp.]|nr:aminopeptidase [Rubrivivax sp.]
MASAAGLAGLALAALALCGLSGCSLGYYAQSVGGHLDLMNRARPVPEVLADPATAPDLRERLALSQRMREFAVQALALPDNASYRRYADLQRGAVVWNVVAAPELSLTLKTWCFPVMGCVGYRGYFDRREADALAAQLRAEGWEVSVYGVPAYSTLGWTNWLGGDPLLNTFIRWPEGELARILFHELAHQVVYVKDDTMFNESYATAVERLGGARWLQTQAGEQARREYAAFDERRRDFRALTLAHRQALAEVYGGPGSEAAKRERKAALQAALRERYGQIKRERWGGFSGYDAWMASANNASFGVQAAYDELVPQFERLFQREGGDFARFHAAVRRLAALPRDERRRELAMTND